MEKKTNAKDENAGLTPSMNARQVEATLQAIQNANRPDAKFIPHEEIEATWKAKSPAKD